MSNHGNIYIGTHNMYVFVHSYQYRHVRSRSRAQLPPCLCNFSLSISVCLEHAPLGPETRQVLLHSSTALTVSSSRCFLDCLDECVCMWCGSAYQIWDILCSGGSVSKSFVYTCKVDYPVCGTGLRTLSSGYPVSRHSRSPRK